MTAQAAPARPGAETASGGKLVPLEAMRGTAAAVVVLYHVILAFTAKGVTSQPATGHAGLDLLLQFLLGLVNGSAAVAVFFVLSGFLVSLPFARSRNPARIAASVLKRWPRLAGLTMLGCLLSVGALTFLALHAALGQVLATVLAALLSIGLAVAGAVPLFRVDQAWTKLVNRAAAPLQPAKARA
ncbi:acyltransferase family protein [Acidocella sp. KAb 2-4]|uniref:acyltransferase family protein n=1 Tax=Acidocella sp. KAb 2-4 TaxID=2885158 RepID=UPI001D070575|nr:acyltransferase family protein [Acidocella sp. KAb 2-4]MCB5945016.1 acyltransferase [Acidocella sp. KAb 2-4]